MISKASTDFWDAYNRLPEEVKELAEKAYERWREDPRASGLRFKHLYGSLWSVRIGIHYRAIGIRSRELDETEDTVVWTWIGTHAEYDRLTKGS